MGTWGVNPFGSDTALDFLDELGQLSPQERLELVVRTLEVASGDAHPSTSAALPEEVISAAAVIAANLPSGESFPWNEEVSGITQWLPKPVPGRLCVLALEALKSALPVGGWWWQSWVDDVDRVEAKSALDRIKSALRGN